MSDSARSDGNNPSRLGRRGQKEQLAALKVELEARMAEAEWLKAHYDEQLRAALAKVADLRSRIQRPVAAPQATARPEALEQAELERLRAELERLGIAERRYLDRIEELKEALARASAE